MGDKHDRSMMENLYWWGVPTLFRAPHEAAYSMQKFIRACFGTHHIDNCSRS